MPRIQTTAHLPAAAQQGASPPPPLSHCCSASQLFNKPAGRAVWVAACISRDTVFDLMLHTVTRLLRSEAARPAVRKRAEGHRLAHCSTLRLDEALRVGCGRLQITPECEIFDTLKCLGHFSKQDKISEAVKYICM